MFRGKRRNNNLRRSYGFFRCTDCDKKWESSHVYCIKGTDQVEYGQECKDCHVMCKPYRVERLRCSRCQQTACHCDKRHVDLNKNHRSDLCGKCRAGNYCV